MTPRRPPHPALPIDDVLDDVLVALRRHPAVVVQAPPGAGKTTRLPLALLKDGFAAPGKGRILLLEPRRLAARAAAATMAGLLGEDVGATVGYQVRFDSRQSRATRLMVVTEGILTRRFADDATLDGIDVVILDEFHERSVHTDLCLALVKELQTIRDDLKLVVMSATLDADAVSSFLDDAPIVTSKGRPFPVTIEHQERKARDDDKSLPDRVAGAARTMMARADDDGGDILCFLPGAGEINRAQSALRQGLSDRDVDVVPLFGALSPADQDRAIKPGPRRKIILSTNVAETSLTIEGVTAVVDSGWMKTLRWDVASDREQLELVRISLASAEQRAGRAGRTRPGRALRLWSAAEHHTLSASHAAEIHRVELARVLLDIALFGGVDPRTFPFFERPSDQHLQHGVRLLQLLGALDDDGRPTPRGRAFGRLPVHPRAAAVMRRVARSGDVEDIRDAALAMALLEDDRAVQLLQPRGLAVTTDSDLGLLLERATGDHRLREVQVSARQLERLVRHDDVDDDVDNSDGVDGKKTSTAALGEPCRLSDALLAGYPDRVCRRRRPDEPDAAMVGGRGVRQLAESGVRSPLFLALSLEGRGAAPGVRLAERITIEQLQAANADALTTRVEAILDDERGAFTGVRRTRFVDLIIDERDGVVVDDDALADGLARTFAQRFERLFRLEGDAEALRARMYFASRALPEDGWPDVDDDALKALLPDICAELVSRGKRRLDDVAKVDWRRHLEGMLSYQQKQRLDAEVPARLEVPTGNAIKVDYSVVGSVVGSGGDDDLSALAPILAVRLQECFGWLETPRVAKGRVPVVLHLLSPGYKPVQVTRDLKSFWARGYAEVKKELKARYPKHSWPEDPLAATPVAKGRSERRR